VAGTRFYVPVNLLRSLFDPRFGCYFCMGGAVSPSSSPPSLCPILSPSPPTVAASPPLGIGAPGFSAPSGSAPNRGRKQGTARTSVFRQFNHPKIRTLLRAPPQTFTSFFFCSLPLPSSSHRQPRGRRASHCPPPPPPCVHFRSPPRAFSSPPQYQHPRPPPTNRTFPHASGLSARAVPPPPPPPPVLPFCFSSPFPSRLVFCPPPGPPPVAGVPPLILFFFLFHAHDRGDAVRAVWGGANIRR